MAFGRLERTSGPQPLSDINMTPLIDVMLVLLVIFILTAPLLASAVRLELPRTEGARPNAAAPFVNVVIEPSGRVLLGDTPVSLAALTTHLQAVAASAPDTEVQLRADASVPYGRVVAVMGAAHQAGLQRIGFVAEPVPTAAPTATP